jgi:tetraacyldisaccharide 4'-kinase
VSVPAPGPVARTLLAPAELLFRAGVRVRNAWFDRQGRASRAPVPVISVGNLAVGGTGKTPLVAWLARRLAAEGHAPAIVSRGYGGTAGPGPLVVSAGGGPRLDARIAGDEPLLLARAVPEAIVIVGSDRVEGAGTAASLGASIVLLDDGFQHRRLARELDVVLLDGHAPFSTRRMLPAGPLREPPSSLRRAGVVVLTRLAETDRAEDAVRRVRKTGFAGPVLRAGHAATGFVSREGRPVEPPARVVAFCGIGDPARFRADLTARGVAVLGFHAFRDHHVLSAPEIRRLAEEARRHGVPLATTEKDLVRLEPAGPRPWGDATLLALAIEARVWDDRKLMDAVRAVLVRRR